MILRHYDNIGEIPVDNLILCQYTYTYFIFKEYFFRSHNIFFFISVARIKYMDVHDFRILGKNKKIKSCLSYFTFPLSFLIPHANCIIALSLILVINFLFNFSASSLATAHLQLSASHHTSCGDIAAVWS